MTAEPRRARGTNARRRRRRYCGNVCIGRPSHLVARELILRRAAVELEGVEDVLAPEGTCTQWNLHHSTQRVVSIAALDYHFRTDGKGLLGLRAW